MQHIVIIGNGITGITVARHVRKLGDHKITVISAESEYFYSRTALMYIYMGHMRFEHTKPYEDWFWAKNRIELKRAMVERVESAQKRLHLKGGETMGYDKLVIAVGSKSNFFGWPGQELEGVRGLYSLQDLEAIEGFSATTKQAVLVGGGLIGVELAEMLRTRNIDVTMLVRESHYWGNILRAEESALVTRHAAAHQVKILAETELAEILPDANGRVKAVRTKQGAELPCQFVGLTSGVSPNIGFLKDSGIETGRGVLVNDCLETNVPDVFAAGDCAEITAADGRNRIEQLWYTGRMQGEVLARTLCGTRTAYDRGIWFNSAKFFDIEYHTYGFVANEERPGETSLYWEHASGKKCMRLVYDEKDHRLVGMNAFGVRYRHPVFEHWLAEGKTVEHVLANLEQANFDPEFQRAFEPSMRDLFLQRNPGARLDVKPRKRLLGIF